MAAATVNKSFVALPWYGATILVVEYTADQSTKTVDLTTLDGGQGLKYVDGLLSFTAGGSLVAIATQSNVASNGTTVTVNDSTTRADVVIGR